MCGFKFKLDLNLNWEKNQSSGWKEGRKEGRKNFLKRKPKAYKALIHDTSQRVNDGNKVSLFTGIALTKDLSKRNTVKGRPGIHSGKCFKREVCACV